MRNDIDWNQIKLAIDSGLISHTNFDVTTKLIESVAMLKLHNIKEFENKKLSKKKTLWNLYCRTAALNLLKFKDCFDISKNYNQAFIYIMVDTRHPNLYKIGRSIEPDQRAATANTFSPGRTYKILSFRYSQEAIKLEKYFHDKYKNNLEGGEWFFFHDILPVIKDLNNNCTRFKLPV
ncbi:hypothetical protein KP1079_00139 [Klebsiella phage KP1079]|nr:hypothetical protein KP1079_00139 [Klebsiella phage KP1079]